MSVNMSQQQLSRLFELTIAYNTKEVIVYYSGTANPMDVTMSLMTIDGLNHTITVTREGNIIQ